MNFPKYWAIGKCGSFGCWGWSDVSKEEAVARGRERAEKSAEFLKRKEPLSNTRYGYGDNRPLREQVLREFHDEAGNLAAVISRNRQGCQVLNTANVMFIDVDLPKPSRQRVGLLTLLFGRKPAPELPLVSEIQSQLLTKAGRVVERDASWGWRIYRTRAGFRLLATHQLFDPLAMASDPLFEELGVDPLYVSLCKAQKCFRARLTPKPWRCQIDGNGQPHVAVAPIIAAHDEATNIGSKLPLA